ncbi:MAG: hypothetical protein ABIR62_17340 [Dokdonella sp.]|uniref:hypothetical protein n=1 Tax=Dokdonella sp. TaxID=2291710 RepID=UPI003264D6A0
MDALFIGGPRDGVVEKWPSDLEARTVEATVLDEGYTISSLVTGQGDGDVLERIYRHSTLTDDQYRTMLVEELEKRTNTPPGSLATGALE